MLLDLSLSFLQMNLEKEKKLVLERVRQHMDLDKTLAIEKKKN